MAGSISLSLSQQFDSTGEPLNGGLLYFYAAGTTTPQSAYQDTSLTIPYPNPIELDAAGRVPNFYLADGQIKIRLTDADGVTQVAADNILVVGASSGTGTPPSVDATTLIQTGFLMPVYGTGAITGFVRANGRTIGNAASGGTERANADTVTLYEWLYAQDTALAVSGGRGASVAADYAANKTIALPDLRGRVIAGFDDMGSTAASRLTATGGMSGSGIGGVSSAQTATLITANLPAYTPAGSISNGAITTTATTNTLAGNGSTLTNGSGGVAVPSGASAMTMSSSQATSTFTGTAQGGTSTAFAIVQPTMFATIYIKL